MNRQDIKIRTEICEAVDFMLAADILIQEFPAQLIFPGQSKVSAKKIIRKFDSEVVKQKIAKFCAKHSTIIEDLHPQKLARASLELLQSAKIDYESIKTVINRIAVDSKPQFMGSLLKLLLITSKLVDKSKEQSQNTFKSQIIQSQRKILDLCGEGKLNIKGNNDLSNYKSNCERKKPESSRQEGLNLIIGIDNDEEYKNMKQIESVHKTLLDNSTEFKRILPLDILDGLSMELIDYNRCDFQSVDIEDLLF